MRERSFVGSLGGAKGNALKPRTDWLGWSGHVAHPDSPAGSGGPGSFVQAAPLNAKESGGPPHQAQPGPLQGAPTQPAQAPQPPNPPPTTIPHSLGSQKSVQNDLVDVSIDACIVADGTTTDADVDARTDFSRPGWNAPSYSTDGSGNITSFNGRFTWRGTIGIQTTYGPSTVASDVSCYGRGTTADDVQNRDITLGFHEQCHREDFERYLGNNVLPDPPDMRIGMPARDFEAELTRFRSELDAYWENMDLDSETRTDEVGHSRSTVRQTGNCYTHNVP